MRQPQEITIRPRPKVLYVNGTFEPVTFVVDQKRAAAAVRHVRGREACQTNDPMPTGRFEQPTPRMPHARPLRVAPMPNACPVTVPMTSRTVVTSTPVSPKTVPAPVPTEPQP